MRTLTCALVLGLTIGFSGCKKKEVAEDSSDETPAAATPSAKPTNAEPKPVAVATPAPSRATPAPEFAPPGVFYLITAVSVETSDGIIGLKPGQMLKLVRPGVYKADNNQVTLRPDQVTNDLAIARKLAVQDQKTQAAIQQRLAASAAAATASQVAAQNAQSAAPATSSAPAALPPNVAARQELMQRKEVLMQQANQLAAQLNQASSHYGSNWEVASRKSPVVLSLLKDYNALRKKLDDINAQIQQY